MGRLLDESVRRSTVVKFGTYDYFVHPLTDGIPAIEPALLDEVASELMKIGDFRADALVTVEAMGIPVAVAVSERTGVPLNIVRKRAYRLPGEARIAQTTGYSKTELFINGLARGMRVTVIDDVVSTGGTLGTLIDALRGLGVGLVDVVVVFEKGDGRRIVESRHSIKVKTLCRVEIDSGRALPSSPPA
ncbi:MAG: adenine phosphoribosyltransferase [Euryarchaeota archaeon]|nr:adenine phosphoribosyltransferase [Euryarchaeota archaeon]